MREPRIWLLAGLLLAASTLAAACGDDDDDGAGEPAATSMATTTPTSTPSPTEAATVTATATATPEAAGGAAAFPETPLVADLTQTYKVRAGAPVPFAAEELPVPPGSVQAKWYQAGGSYVVLYAGWSTAVTGPLCPGNSIQTEAGFQHISNAPTHDGACEGATTLAGPEAGLRPCGDLVVYVTAIPSDLGGNLFGTIERFEADGAIIGVTSVAAVTPGAAPEVDLDAICGA
jgi:hypothetical protein